MNKKLLSLIMAIAMIASLAIPVFADDPPEGTGSGELVYTATTENPVVTVTMPDSAASGDIILNPYGMSVTVSGDDYTSQIISATRFIENKTLSPMKVGVTATFIKSGDVVYSNRPCTGRETTKNAYLIVEFKNLAAKTEPNASDWKLQIASGDIISGDTINERLYPQIVPTEEGKTAAAIMSVPAATNSTTPNYIGVKVFGNLASAPQEAWKSTDTARVKLEFTFTPSVAHTVTADGTTVTASSTITETAGATAKAVMGTIVRLDASNSKMPTAKDANGNDVAVTQVSEKVYYLTMPATDVTVTAGT